MSASDRTPVNTIATRAVVACLLCAGLVATPARAPGAADLKERARTATIRVLASPPSHELRLVNHLSLKIAPSLGTQLYFPFVLDQVDSVVPFTVNVTNAEVFLIKINKDRNFILISVPPDARASEIGSLFIVVADRHLNIRLGVGAKDEHTEAVYFTFSEEVQTQLIDQAVWSARVQMERELERRLEEVRQQSGREAIAYVAELAQVRPRRINVRENLRGQHHRLYLHRVWEYQKFSIVFVEISTASAGSETEDELRIDSVHLSTGDGQVRTRHNGYLRCQTERAVAVCTVVFDRLGHWRDYEQVEIEIRSSRGLDSFVY